MALRKPKSFNSMTILRAGLIVLLDVLFTMGSFFVALWFRADFSFENIYYVHMAGYLSAILPWCAITVLVFFCFRLYSSIWSFVSVPEVFRIVGAYAVLAVIGVSIFRFDGRIMPRSSMVLGFIFSFIGTVSIRFSYRLYLTAFFDARSGIFTGCYVTNAPSSQSTLIALRRGILKYGIPENIYVDNGREFLTYDVGGLGHRKKKPKDGQERFEPPPVFERLGIHMTNAIVCNAKAKVIERRFRDVKDHLSRLFDTFTGGNVLEKPERLKSVLKDGRIPLDATLVETVEDLLDWYFNQQPYGGAVARDHGKPRQQVYNENLHTKRVASAEDLNLMLMRSSRAQKVTRRGVHLDIAGQRIDYWNDELVFNYLGQQVYYRYDPDDLSEVRVYDLQDRFIMTVPADNTAVLTYGASKEEVKEAMAKVRRMERITKEAKKVSTFPAFGRHTALELVMEAAHESKAARIIPPADPKVLALQRPDEEPLLKAVAGGPDLDTMNRNAMKRNGGAEYE